MKITVPSNTQLFRTAEKYADYYSDPRTGEYWPQTAAYSRLKSQLQTPGALFFIAEEDGEILGYIAGYMDRYGEENAFHFQKILVFEQYQNQGIGSALIRYLLDQLRRQSVSSIYGESLNDEAHRHFYEANGFTIQPQLVCWKQTL